MTDTPDPRAIANPHARLEVSHWQSDEGYWCWYLNVDGETEMESSEIWEGDEKQDCIQNAKRVAAVLGIEVTDEYGQSVE